MNWAIFATDLKDKTYWLPLQLSKEAAETDVHFYLLYWLNVFFFVGIFGLVVYFCVKYRRRTPDQKPLPAPSHNTVLELVWSIIPSLICIGLFYIGFMVYQDLMEPPRETFKINVVGGKWNWEFTYPKTGLLGTSDGPEALPELHVPANIPIELIMTSKDVIHCLYIPVLRTKKDVVPGRYSKLWFNAQIPGIYNIYCAEYCGTSHSEMTAKLVVHENMEKFLEWQKKKELEIDNKKPVELGDYVWKAKGCRGCHSIDGSPGTGPTFKGLWGMPTEEHKTWKTTGSLTPTKVDENYIRMSINEPNDEVRDGFGRPSAMPSYKGRLSDKQITGVIEYLKTLGRDTQPPVKQ